MSGSAKRESSKGAFRIAAAYAVVAGLWIFFSDELVELLVGDPRVITRLSIYKGMCFVLVTATLLYWLIRRHMEALRARERSLREVTEGVAAATGEEFFPTLVRNLSKALQADYAFVGELTDDTPPAVRTVAAFGNGELLSNFSYDLPGTPCADVFAEESAFCFFPANVAEIFPQDPMLGELGIQAYIGTPLRNSAGRAMGLLAVMNRAPVPEKKVAESLFQLFAIRAAGELERRQTEQALRKSEFRFRQLMEHSPVAICVIDRGHRIEYLNRKFVDTFGYTMDEIPATGDWWPRAYPDEDYRRHMVAFWHDAVENATGKGLEIGPVEEQITSKDGRVLFMEVSGAPIAGKVLLIYQDVTERKQAEEALKSQFDQMSTIFDSLNALVYVADMETQELLYMNRYGTRQFGAGWQGKKCFDVLQAGQEEPCEFCTNTNLTAKGVPQPDWVWEFRNTLTGRWFQCIDRAITWTDGRLVRLEIAIDITERKEMEQLKDQIISAISHEMRTPLTAMMGFTEFLLESNVDPAEQKQFLATIYKETRRLNELISNFLDLQQLKARLVKYQFNYLEVLPLLQDAAAVFAFDQDHHRIQIDCPSDLPMIKGDEARLHQVLTNLISNGIKYSPAGTVITVGAGREGDHVTIWVKDEGVGIPNELKDRIFERFYRLDNSDRRMVGGTGLGLAIVQELVAVHGGVIRVESTLGKGSTFFIDLPIPAEPEEAQVG